MDRRLKFVVFALVMAGSLAFAKDSKDGSTPEGSAAGQGLSAKLTTDVQFGLSWDFADTSIYSGETDYQLVRGGPEYEIDVLSALLFKSPGKPALRAGPFLKVSADLESKTRGSSSGEPYMVLGEYRAQTDLGWRTEYTTALGTIPLKLRLDAFGGASFWHFTDADSAYTPIGADAEAFWSRVLPEIGLRASAKTRLSGPYEASLSGFYIARRELEDDQWRQSPFLFEAGFDLGLGWEKELNSLIETKWVLDAGIEWDSGIVYSERKISAAVANSYKIDGNLTLTVIPVFFDDRERGKDFGEAVESLRTIGSGLGWKNDLGGGDFSVDLEIPWLATDIDPATDDAPKIWSVSVGWEYSK